MTTSTCSFIFIDFDTLSITVNNVPYNVDSSHENWDEIITALKASEYDRIPGLINVSKELETFVGLSNIVVNAEYGTITYHGQPIHNTLVDHIFRMKDEGFNINPMLQFLNNLMENPSRRAVEELYSFLQAGKMPITEDGCFIAYKRVRDNYTSTHDGKTINTPYDKMTTEQKRSMPHKYNGVTTSIETKADGSKVTVLSMPRNLVNENSQQTCSQGLHFCSQGYLGHFSGDRILILKVNPRDVVSIPADYNDTKGRACRYEITGELSDAQKQEALQRNIFTEAVHREVEKKAEKKEAAGPKMTDGYFGKGYVNGWLAGATAGEYNDENPDYFDTTTEQDEVYVDGYDQGYDDGSSGRAPRYTTAEAGEDFGNGVTDLEGSNDGVVTKVSDGYFAKGYTNGFTAAKDGLSYDDFNPEYEDTSMEQDRVYEEGYAAGWSDAVNGQVMRYVTSAAECEYAVPAAPKKFVAKYVGTEAARYQQGYADGKGHKAKKYYTDRVYLEGYADGRNKRPAQA